MGDKTNTVKMSLILNSGKVTKLTIQENDFHVLIDSFIKHEQKRVELSKLNQKTEKWSSCFINVDDISLIDLD